MEVCECSHTVTHSLEIQKKLSKNHKGIYMYMHISACTRPLH